LAGNARLQTDARLIDDLVEQVTSGGIRIPSFQRGLKWQRSDVVRLFDSIARGYPIGNLLLWRRPAPRDNDVRIGALRMSANETDSALFVVDGQQRLTSLANALTDEGHADPRFALAYDVERERFVEVSGRSIFEIPLPDLFDISRLLNWFGSHPEVATSPYIERANNIAKALKDFRVPVYIVEQPDEAVLRDIFDRMNTYGKKLTRAEVFSALNSDVVEGADSENGLRDLDVIAADVHSATGFGVLDESTILLAMLARRGPNISRDIRGEFQRTTDGEVSVREFPSETATEARAELVKAMIRAVVFLQRDAQVPHFSFLPYRYLIVVLTRFFAHFPTPTPTAIRSLRRWFWRAAVLGPQVTKGNITSVTRTLCNRIDPSNEWNSIEGLLEVLGSDAAAPLQIGAFRTNQAATRILLSAMWDLGPCDIDLSEPGVARRYELDELIDELGEGSSALPVARTIIDSRDFSDKERSRPSNRLLILDRDAGPVDPPLESLTLLAQRALAGDSESATILESHGIEGDAAESLASGDPHAFLVQRDSVLQARLTAFVVRQMEWEFEDTPPLETLFFDEEDDALLRDDVV